MCFWSGTAWEIPGAKHFKGAAGAILGGWNVSGALRYESGRPYNIFMNNDLGGLIFSGQKRPSCAQGTNAIARRLELLMPWADPWPALASTV